MGVKGELPFIWSITMRRLLNPYHENYQSMQAQLDERGKDLLGYMVRHLSGDWGDLADEDKQENEFSMKNGFRILSAYITSSGKLWIITEADRSATTFLLPEEY